MRSRQRDRCCRRSVRNLDVVTERAPRRTVQLSKEGGRTLLGWRPRLHRHDPAGPRAMDMAAVDRLRPAVAVVHSLRESHAGGTPGLSVR